MPLISWSESLSVGITEIDAQHKELVEQVNLLHEAMRAGKGQQEILAILGNLVTYTKVHFAAEENLMRRIGYGEYAGHKAKHEALTQQVLQYQAQASASTVGLSVQVNQFLKDWLINHIQGDDMLYKPLAQQKGIR